MYEKEASIQKEIPSQFSHQLTLLHFFLHHMYHCLTFLLQTFKFFIFYFLHCNLNYVRAGMLFASLLLSPLFGSVSANNRRSSRPDQVKK